MSESRSPQGTVVAGCDGTDAGRDALALATLLARETSSRVVSSRASGAAELRHVVEDEHADLLVLGSSARSRALTGSVAKRLLHSGPCPIALAPAGYAERDADRIRVVMVAFNGSPEAHAAVDVAEQLALRAGATIRLVGVSELGNAGFAASDVPSATNGEFGHRLLRDRLLEVREALAPELRADARMLAGDAARRILDEAELGVDVVVMGSRGFGVVMRALLGSVSGTVARQAPCPVVVVPWPARDEHADALAEPADALDPVASA
jgi:nucleotide-binding universal stress UspA family protein